MEDTVAAEHRVESVTGKAATAVTASASIMLACGF